MLLFHGTGGGRDLIQRIFADGLLPHGGREWADRLTGVAAHVFACTSPIGTRDGDPIRWAQRLAWKQRRAWLVVIDLPDDAARDLVVGAIRNEELTQFWRTESFVDATITSQIRDTRRVIDHARARGLPARDLLRPVVLSATEGLVAGTPDADTLIQFEAAYLRARASQKARVAASYGLAIPTWFAEDPHYSFCTGCMHNLFDVAFVATEVLDGLGNPVRFRRGTWTRLDLVTFGANLDALGRWLATCDPVALDRFIARRAGVPWLDLQRAFPPPAGQVPRTFMPDLARADLAARMREPDTQLLMLRVPPPYVVGAIDLGNTHRLSPLVRPRRGEVLLDKLRHLVAELCAARERDGHPVVLA